VKFVLEGFHRKEYVIGAYLDIQKAFHRAWHEGLLRKLKSLLNPQLYLIIKSFLHKRSFKVVQDGLSSQTKRVRAGLPQGSVLGPTL